MAQNFWFYRLKNPGLNRFLTNPRIFKLPPFCFWWEFLVCCSVVAFVCRPSWSAHSCTMTEWNLDNHADLGMWEELGRTQPPPEKKAKNKSLKLRMKVAETDGENYRFVSPSKDLETYQQPYCPKNTAVFQRTGR